MDDGKLILPGENGPTRRGPPNRMNDLPYREWMKFQKSFFRLELAAPVSEWILFFTKATWEDGRASQVIISGINPPVNTEQFGERKITWHPGIKTLSRVIELLDGQRLAGSTYDFVYVDLSADPGFAGSVLDTSKSAWKSLAEKIADLLLPRRYCCVVVNSPGPGGAGLPLPWYVANDLGTTLKLRDERIGIGGQSDPPRYFLIFQNEHDGVNHPARSPVLLRTVSVDIAIPAWIMPKSPPRTKSEIAHPAKFPEALVTSFIELFSKPGDNVLDPMVGTGSTVVAALRSGRNGYGVDIVPAFADLARRRAASELGGDLFSSDAAVQYSVVCGDATHLSELKDLSDTRFNYAITSPPYWSMLSNPGSENQASRRKRDLALQYSEDQRDLGNVADYDAFVALLSSVYSQVAQKLVRGGYLTVVVKNVKRNRSLYTLAWDIVDRLSHGKDPDYDYVGTTLWCQDDISIKPFAVGIDWVSNILHHYCLHFRVR